MMMICLSLNPSCSLPQSNKTASPKRFDSFSLANRKFKCRRWLNTRILSKMDVPSDSFGGLSPERYASNMMTTFLTFAACRIVMYQMEGKLCHGERGAYNNEAYNTLQRFLVEKPLKNADEWLTELMKENEMLAVRIMECRVAYATQEDEGFEWKNVKRLAEENIRESNVKLMREHASKFESMMDDGK